MEIDINLTGSKFGGYGSFLPSYQRSPVWSHPKTSPKVQNHNASKSPNNLTLEVDILIQPNVVIDHTCIVTRRVAIDFEFYFDLCCHTGCSRSFCFLKCISIC